MSSFETIDTDEHEEAIAAILNILSTIKSKITDDAQVTGTRFNSAAEMRFALDTYVYQVRHGNADAFMKLEHDLSPTGYVKTHAMANGWGNEYQVLAKRFDTLYKQLMK